MLANRLKTASLLIFGLPGGAMEVVSFPMYAIVPTIYAQHTVITLAQISTVLLVTRLVDVFFDPVIGVLSDQTRTAIGARKPWMLAGAVVLSAGTFFAFSPKHDSGLVYFLVASLVWYVGWSMIDTPYQAWASEITHDYNERSRVFVIKNGVQVAGVLLFASVPYVTGRGDAGFTPDAVRLIGIIACIALPLTIAIACLVIPAGHVLAQARPKFRELAKGLFASKSLRLYYLTAVCTGYGVSLSGSLLFLFFGDHLKVGYLFPLSIIISMIAQIAFLPLTLRLACRIGKPKVWSASLTLLGLTTIAFGFLPPGQAAVVPVIVLSLVRGIALAGNNPMTNAVLSDAIDLDLLQNRVNRAGNLFAVQSFLTKANTALGAALAFFLLPFGHYNVSGPNTPAAGMWLVFVFALLPGAIMFGAAAMAYRFPIDARRHDIIRRRLEERVRRSAAYDAAAVAAAIIPPVRADAV